MLEHKKYIKKVVVEVETASMDQAMIIKQQSETLFGTDFYKLLENILEEILQKYHPKYHYKFETICAEISISDLENTSELKREMEMKIRAKIDEEIRQTSVENSSSNQALNSHKSYDGFLHYLIHGMYPWWEQFTDKIDEETMNYWLTDDTFIKKIKKLVSKTNALDRLIYTTDNKIFKKILCKFLVLPKSATFKENEVFASSTSVETRIVYWRALLSFGLAKDIKIFTKIFTNLELKISTQLTAESLKNILENTSEIIQQVSTISEAEMIVIQQQILEAFSNKKTIEKNAIEKKENEAHITKVEDVIFSEEKEIYVSNAGLILLHPFLESLFKKLNYLENGLLNKSSWEEATHVLHYLATKQEQPHEHALLFPKYLCGIAQNTPIYKFQQLSEATKAECENVLQAVLHYWPGLKTNSVDILRTEFLTREGKLTLTSDLEKLYIQRKAQDILLDNIPWTIGIAKLPWKKQLIYTEW